MPLKVNKTTYSNETLRLEEHQHYLMNIVYMKQITYKRETPLIILLCPK